MRFDPPALAVPPALRWVLLRALGPRDGVQIRLADGSNALELARATALASLIGSRYELGHLACEVGGRAASAFVLEHGAARRAAEDLLAALPMLTAAARVHGSPLVLLKFAALTVAGHSPPGTRTAGDLDVLMTSAAIEGVVSAMRARGFADIGFPDGSHAADPLRDGDGRVVDLHHCIPGVRLSEGGAPATVGELEDANLLEPAAGFPAAAGSLVPVRELLAAHAIVHGIADHGSRPQSYPLFRMVADLVALDASSCDPGQVHRWISGEVSEEETKGAMALAGRLAQGDRSLFDSATSLAGEAVLFRHIVAALVDSDYARSLRFSWPGPDSRRGVAARAQAAWRAVAITDTQIDAVYGPLRSRWGYAFWRAARPFDLVGRAARYALSAVRVRIRR